MGVFIFLKTFYIYVFISMIFCNIVRYSIPSWEILGDFSLFENSQDTLHFTFYFLENYKLLYHILHEMFLSVTFWQIIQICCSVKKIPSCSENNNSVLLFKNFSDTILFSSTDFPITFYLYKTLLYPVFWAVCKFKILSHIGIVGQSKHCDRLHSRNDPTF